MLREPSAPGWKTHQDPAASLSEDKGASSRRPKGHNQRTQHSASKEHQTGIHGPSTDCYGKPSQVALLCGPLPSPLLRIVWNCLRESQGADGLGFSVAFVCYRDL